MAPYQLLFFYQLIGDDNGFLIIFSQSREKNEDSKSHVSVSTVFILILLQRIAMVIVRKNILKLKQLRKNNTINLLSIVLLL